MIERLRRAVEWVREHVFVQTRDLQDRSDELRVEDAEPKPSVTVGFKFRF